MSNVIDFFERMGQDAQLKHLSKDSLEVVLIRAAIDPEIQAAILNCDDARLTQLLGATANVCCAIAPSRQDEEEEEPAKDDDEITSRLMGVASAA